MINSQIHILMQSLNTANDDIDKEILIKEYRRVLRKFATEILRLDKSDFVLSNSKGGWASEAEVILHTDNAYISVCPRKGMSIDGHQILYRKCKDRNDNCGGMNHFISAKEAFSESSIKEFAKKIAIVSRK